MSRRARWPIAALAVLACAVPGVALGQDDERKQDNFAVAVTQVDGGRAFDFSWEVIRQKRGPVDSFNGARAVAQCVDCRAAAIAFQVVLAWGDGSGQNTAHNAAEALNAFCTRCVVYAGAKQITAQMSGPTRFTGDGRATLADVRNQIRALEASDLDADQLKAAVDAQWARVVDAVVNQTEAIDGEGSTMIEDRDEREADDA
jgi:hypothetical protein